VSQDYTILGRIRVRIGGEFQDWGPPRLRAILGVLLVHANRPMPFGGLIEWAWREHDEPPRHREGTFHTYAKRIRNVLNRMDVPASLAVQNGNLQLDVERSSIDYHRARLLIDRARVADRDNDHRLARELAEEAVDLWAGPPLAELDTARVGRWRQSIIDTFWLPANTFLLGQHAALGELDKALARLDELQADYPQHPGLAKYRVQILYRLGRGRDADSYYFAHRRRMLGEADDEGAEDLRRFHDEVRNGSTDTPVPASQAAEPPDVPMRLPHAIPDFAGRADLLRELDGAATSDTGQLNAAILVLNGLPGVGKTSLAVHWARRRHDHHGDGALFVDLHGFDHGPPIDAAHVVDDLLHELAFPVDRIAGYPGRAAKLRELLAHHRLVVVLDNARDAAQVQPLLPLLSTCLVVVTSRQWLSALGARSFAVTPLSHQDAMRFLAGRIGDRAAQDPSSVDALAALCGGLPLTLQLVADNIAPQRGIRLADHVDHLRNPPALLDLGDDVSSSATAFTISYQALPEPGRRLFRLLGLHPGPSIGVATVAAMAGQSVAEVVRDLGLLLAAHLVEHSGAVDRYRCHDLIGAYAARIAESDEHAEERVAAEQRMLDFYLHSAFHADRVVFAYVPGVPMPAQTGNVEPLTFADEQAAVTWLLRERRALVAAVEYAFRHGYHDHAWRLPHTTLSIFRRYGYFDDALATLNIAILASKAAGVPEAEGAALADSGRIQLTLGNHVEARKMFHLAKYFAEANRSELGVATSLCNIAQVEMHEGDYDKAIMLYQQAFETAQRFGDVRTQSVAQHQLGNVFRTKKQYERAVTHYMDALSHRQMTGNRRGEGETLTELAALYCERGDYALAKAYGMRALDIIEQVQDVETGQQVCVVLADVYRHLGDGPQAIQFARRAVGLAHHMRNGEREARALDSLGRCLLAQGRVGPAVEAFQQAIRLYRDLRQEDQARRIADLLRDPPLSDAG
jgi:tetratricopeptide (TPR) repeat protein/DNA-binding SARP family transcriptional activator